MAKTLIYIQEHGHTDYPSLQNAYSSAVDDYNAIINKRTKLREKIKDLKAVRSAATEYRNTRKVYDEYNAPLWIPKFKKEHYEKNKDKIEAHKKAKSYIYDELKLTKFPNLKDLSEEIKQLTEEAKALTDSIPEARERYKTLNVINHNARLLLGYKSLEQKSIDPVSDIQSYGNTKSYVDIPVYKATFITATNTGDTALYFQNAYLNRECAEAIKNAASLDMGIKKNEIAVAIRLIETYGIERVKWVMATVITNDTSDSFAKYKDWAEKMELPNEPIDKSVYDIGDTKRMLYPNLVRAVQTKDAEIRHGKGEKLSYEDSMAVAKLKADEHNRRNEECRAQTVVAYTPPQPIQRPTQQPHQQAQQKPAPVAETPPPQKRKSKGMSR